MGSILSRMVAIVNKYIYILHFCFNNNFFHSKKAEKYKTDAHQQLSTRPDTKPGPLQPSTQTKRKHCHKYGCREIIKVGPQTMVTNMVLGKLSSQENVSYLEFLSWDLIGKGHKIN